MVTYLEATLLYVMFLAASKVKTWSNGLIDNRLLDYDNRLIQRIKFL